MSEYTLDWMPDRVSDKMPEYISFRMSEYLPDWMPERMSEHVPNWMPEYMSDRMPWRGSHEVKYFFSWGPSCDWKINQRSGWSTWSLMFQQTSIPEWWVCESPGLFPCPSPFAWSIIEWPLGMGCQTIARGWETLQHFGTDVHCNQDFARQDDENQSIVADSHLESVRTFDLYSQRCSISEYPAL